jgi:pimeloyl-ACP methyl ester carboxylesterase
MDGTTSSEEETTLTRDDGTRLRCRLVGAGAGAGPTVVLAHGYLDALETYDEVVPRLVRAGRRVVLFDQRAHGKSTIGTDGVTPRSMAGDYLAVLERFDVMDAVLVGHSMGAFLSVVFSILHADEAKKRLRGLVLVGGHAGGAREGSLQNRIQVVMLERGVAALAMKNKWTARAFARPLFGAVVEERHLQHMMARVQPELIPGTLPILRAQLSQSFYDRLGEILVPAVVICGERDRTCPRFHSERLGARIKGSRNVWLPDIGHMVPYEAPGAIIDAIDGYFATMK